MAKVELSSAYIMEEKRIEGLLKQYLPIVLFFVTLLMGALI